MISDATPELSGVLKIIIYAETNDTSGVGGWQRPHLASTDRQFRLFPFGERKKAEKNVPFDDLPPDTMNPSCSHDFPG